MRSDQSSIAATATPPRAATVWAPLLWGFAEATLFFIVPDVWLTRLAIKHTLRTAFVACLIAVAGALLGGALIWSAAQRGPEAASQISALFDHLPGISPAMIAQSRESLAEHGPVILFQAALSGIPYKLYALHAGALGLSLPWFLTVSAAARLSRFLITCLMAWGITRGLRRYFNETTIIRIHAICWIVFYAFYFSVHRG